MFFTYFSAFWAAVLWMGATVLLVVHSDGLTFDISLIASHLMGNFTPLLIGLLILVDIALDTYIIGNADGIFRKRPGLALKLVVLTIIVSFFGAIISQVFSEISPDIVKIAAGFALVLLFLVRLLSYIKITEVDDLRLPTQVDAD